MPWSISLPVFWKIPKHHAAGVKAEGSPHHRCGQPCAGRIRIMAAANGALHRDQLIIPRTHADGFGILNLMPAPRIRMQCRELVVAAGVRAVLAQRNEAVRFLHQLETGRVQRYGVLLSEDTQIRDNRRLGPTGASHCGVTLSRKFR